MERTGLQHEQIETILLEQMKVAFWQHKAARCSVAEYSAALARFAEFIVDGRIPNNLDELAPPDFDHRRSWAYD